MFFLWGILIASPVVAVPLLGVIWFVQTLLTPLAAGDNRSFRWNRPSFTLAVVTTVIALAVVAASIYNAVNEIEIEIYLLVAMNVSSAFLVVTFLVVAIECFKRAAISATSIVTASSIGVLLAAALSWIVLS